MSELLAKDLIRYDPLSETTRKERRALLGLSILSIAIVRVPLIPNKISAFGLEFSELNQRNLLQVIAAILAYFTAAFIVYAFSDLVAWRRGSAIQYGEYLRQQKLAHKDFSEEELRSLQRDFTDPNGCPYRGLASYRAGVVASVMRALFEFLLPIAVASFAITTLLRQ